MKPNQFAAALAHLEKAQREHAEQQAAIFALAHRHMLPDVEVEGYDALCVTCQLRTPGAWQHGGGGRRLRTPSEHAVRGETCPGSFAAAVLRDRPTTGDNEQ